MFIGVCKFVLELIDWALKSSKIDHRIKSNEFVDIEKLSGGERIRLLIARIIYAVKNHGYISSNNKETSHMLHKSIF